MPSAASIQVSCLVNIQLKGRYFYKSWLETSVFDQGKCLQILINRLNFFLNWSSLGSFRYHLLLIINNSGSTMPEENDMIVRDPNNLNGHLGVSDQHWVFLFLLMPFSYGFQYWSVWLKLPPLFLLTFDESRKGMDCFNQTEYW